MLNYQYYIGVLDADKKDAEWAAKLITEFRMVAQPLITRDRATKNRAVILSEISMDTAKSMFKDPTKLGDIFIPIIVMEKVRNILIGERVKAGISATVYSTDSSSTAEKEADKKLLGNRKDTEELLTHLQTSIGLPPYKLENEKNRTGKSVFNGNVEKFDQLGLDDSSDFDKGYFFEAWHQLFHEMDAQLIINNLIRYNEVEENIPRWVNDILATKIVAQRSYVNDMNGEVVWKYVAPEAPRIVPGTRSDGKDAACWYIEEMMTVSELLRNYGNYFDLENELPYILNAVNFTNGYNYTDLSWDGMTDRAGLRSAGTCMWEDFVNFKVCVGYIEWKTWNQTVAKTGVDYHGNLRFYERDANYQPNEDTPYHAKASYEQVTKKAYYLATSGITQRIYRYGDLFHQVIEGAEDERSSYSLFFKKEMGKTVAEIAKPYIDIVQECFTKFRWMVRRAKPKGRSYNYNSLAQIANKLVQAGTDKVKIETVMKMFSEGVDELYMEPKVDGKSVGGGANPNFDLPNGLDPTAIQFKDLIDWAVEKIKEDLGITQVRDAYSPKPNDGQKLQEMTLQSSMNATNYIGEQMDCIARNGAAHSLIMAQDIIRYKTSMAYHWLLRLIGKEAIDRLEELGAVAHHRYGIFVNSFSTYQQRQEVKGDTKFAFQQGFISYKVKMLIDNIDDFRKAALVLSCEEERVQRQKQQEAAQAQQNIMQQKDYDHKAVMEEEDLKGKWKDKAADTSGHWQYLAAKEGGDSRQAIKQMQLAAEPDMVDHKSDAKIREGAAKAHTEFQKPI